MTNDDGRKPEGAPERSPNAGAGAPSGVDGGATVARQAAGTGGPRDEWYALDEDRLV